MIYIETVGQFLSVYHELSSWIFKCCVSSIVSILHVKDFQSKMLFTYFSEATYYCLTSLMLFYCNPQSSLSSSTYTRTMQWPSSRTIYIIRTSIFVFLLFGPLKLSPWYTKVPALFNGLGAAVLRLSLVMCSHCSFHHPASSCIVELLTIYNEKTVRTQRWEDTTGGQTT